MQIELQVLPTIAPPWEQYFLPCSFPLGLTQRTPILLLLEQLANLLNADGLLREVLLHSWKLAGSPAGATLQQNLTTWLPALGMGIWPDRQPPSPLTQERFMDLAAGSILGEEPELTVCRLLRLTGTAQARKAAFAALFGTGATTQMFSSQSFEAVQKAGEQVYLPTITAPIYTHERFYLPLLDRRSVNRAKTAAELGRWLCDVEVYVRESAEDQGVLILSRRPLHDHLLTAAKRSETTLNWTS